MSSALLAACLPIWLCVFAGSFWVCITTLNLVVLRVFAVFFCLFAFRQFAARVSSNWQFCLFMCVSFSCSALSALGPPWTKNNNGHANVGCRSFVRLSPHAVWLSVTRTLQRDRIATGHSKVGARCSSRPVVSGQDLMRSEGKVREREREMRLTCAHFSAPFNYDFNLPK